MPGRPIIPCEPVPAAADGQAGFQPLSGSFQTKFLGILGPDGRIVAGNPELASLFVGGSGTDMLRNQLAAPHGATAHGRITVADGRAFAIETLTIAEGLLVVADDLSLPRTSGSEHQQPGCLDPVTGLGDPRTFREQVRRLLASRRSDETPASVLLIDLDRFKAVNNTLGHTIGDKLLRAVADRVRTELRHDGIAARFGADEFAILQSGTPVEAAALAERLVDLLGRPYLIDGHILHVSVTIGIAPLPTGGSSGDDVLRRANLALREARRGGGGTHRIFACAMEDRAQARHSLEIDLRRALALRELGLVYQPQYNVATRRITGFETLLRWYHPARGIVSPGEFIPLAEEIGLIVPIGAWALRSACRVAARWPEPLKVAVNVSALQFRGHDLAPTIIAALNESGLDPHRLELEITESTLLTDQQGVLDLLHEVRDLGVQVAMDDFGTGYSSLSYLRSFPFDKIKIDQGFVRGDPNDPTGAAIICAIAALGQRLGIATMAEGVETEEQLARIAADGCTDVQGYIISKPLTADRVEPFLRRSGRISDMASFSREEG